MEIVAEVEAKQESKAVSTERGTSSVLQTMNYHQLYGENIKCSSRYSWYPRAGI